MEKIKETLEEAAHKMLVDYGIKSMGQSIGVLTVKKLMVDMAQWQAERMYSKEELHKCKYCGVETTQPDEECYAKTNKETIEEAAKKYCLINNIPIDQMIVKTDRSCEFETPITMFIAGAKWQQERMYSEEEVLEIILYAINSCTDGISCSKHFFEQWFEQFKK